MGSCESGVACGPYPGFAALYFASAHGWNAGSFALKVIRFCFSSQTPDRSVVEVPLWLRTASGRLASCANESGADENTIAIASTAIELSLILRNCKLPGRVNISALVLMPGANIGSILLSISLLSTGDGGRP